MELHEFITSNREELIARTRAKVARRPGPSATGPEAESGVPLFLTQLAETLRLENTGAPFPPNAIGSSATRHGGDLLAMGFTVSQVVHGYGDVCQAVTELSIDRSAKISSEEFHTLNRCLDTAIAEAVTEHGRLQRDASEKAELGRRGQVAHELRNKLHTALLAFEALKTGTVGIGGSTGLLLGRSLSALCDLIDGSLTEVRLEAGTERRSPIALDRFVDELAVAAKMHAVNRGVQFTVGPIDPSLSITVDPQLLVSAVMNLLQNAFKFTRDHGRVTLTGRAEDGRVLIEVEDECGGFDASETDLFQSFGERRRRDRSGLGLGLSICQRAVTASGGEIHTRNIPGKGCVFTVDLPAVS